MKTRLWICDRCGAVYRRYLTGINAMKTLGFPSDTPRLHCGRPMRAAHTWPSSEWYNKFQHRHEKQAKVRMAERKHFGRVWSSEGTILQTSSVTRKAWRRIEALQRGGSFFIKRATAFLLCVRKDLGQYGSQGIPKVRFDTVPGCHGTYNRALLKGVWEIVLTPAFPLSEIRDTFLHEALHWIDDQSSSHHKFGKLPGDHFEFENRLANLRKRLGCKPYEGKDKAGE